MIKSEDLPRLRANLGATAKLWAGEDGVRIEPGRYAALSGAGSVDYNVIVCYGTGEDQVSKSLEEITALGAPGLIMVADEALGDVQPLVDADWVCIGQTAFMGLELDPSAEVPDDPNIRRLEPSELDAARALTEVTFGLDPKDALVAMPPDAASRPGQVVWGVFSDDGELACTTMGAWVEDTITYWGIATAPAFRRQGYASRLTGFMFPHDAQLGMRYVVAHTTPYGEALTKALGFEVLERWQMWSRPRWVLGRS